jgi:hypothetical protein
MADIKLNLINHSNDHNNSSVVILQKNQATSYDELAVAWQVISNMGQGWNHPFVYPMATTIAASDSWGNFSPQLEASNGQQFSVVKDSSGDILRYSGSSAAANQMEVLNALQQGAINANVYKDGKLLATKTSVAPGQKAVFHFEPTLWIGVVSQVVEGQVVDSAILSNINTEISLFGIASADIIMTGGGTGPDETPFVFTLTNVQYA